MYAIRSYYAGTAIRCGGFVENIEAFPFDGATSAVVVRAQRLIGRYEAIKRREERTLAARV